VATEDDRNERRVLLVLALGLALFAAKVHASHRPRPAAPLTAVAAPRPKADARASIVLTPGQVTLTGLVASESERASLVASARGAFPTADVTDTLRVAPEEPPRDTLRAVLAACGPLRWGALSATAEGLALEGEVPPTVDRDALTQGLRRLAHGPLAISLTTRPAPAAEPHVLQATLTMLFNGPLHFSPNHDELDGTARTALDALVPSLTRLEGLEVTIEIAPNPAEPAAEWRSLALARAAAVKAYLVSKGAPAARLAIAAKHLPPALPSRLPLPQTLPIEARFFVREARSFK